MGLANLIGQVVDEKYGIEKELGRGGMGAVYLATHLGTGRPVAVKVIAPQFMASDEFIERFKREAKAAGRLRHPNVVDVTDFGFSHVGPDRVGSERVAYLVMEYLDGCTLAEILAEESRLPLEWVVDILEQACSAVDEAHQQGIIHRDLKPDNIWLEPNRRGGYTVKVLDFGLAKLADATATEPAPLAPGLQSSGASTTVAQSPALTSALPRAAEQFETSPGDAERTRILSDPSPNVDEQATELLQPGPRHDAESATQLLPPSGPEEPRGSPAQLPPSSLPPATASPSSLPLGSLMRQDGGTGASEAGKEDEGLGMVRRTVRELHPAETAPADGLTRLGSILGTPLYMSPEQCRGAPLDARTDIYSLGVIAYQMLAGDPPFRGDVQEVMRLHMEAAPPPLKEKGPGMPKRTAALLMSALAKDPADRPAGAAQFSAALRASTEGTGALTRRAFALYSQHFPPLFKISLVVQLPVIAFGLLQLVVEVLNYQHHISKIASQVAQGALGFLSFLATFLSYCVTSGVTILLVTQLILAPHRPVQLRSALAALKKRLRPFMVTTFMVGAGSIIGLILGVVPGLIFYIHSLLAAPVVIMENLKGRAAIRRSWTLVKRSRLTVIAIMLIQYAIPSVADGIVLAVIVGFFKGLNPSKAELIARIATAITIMLKVLIIPLIAILTALLYLKTRQMGGETLRETLNQFEEADRPQSKWQLRIRERLSGSNPSGR